MITKEQFQQAASQKESAQNTINDYLRQEAKAFEQRMATKPVFTEDELVFSAEARCPCGYGLAYPRGCGMHHYWDCAAILLGNADTTAKHTDKLPFVFYDVKSESEYRGSTRKPLLSMNGDSA